MLQLLIDKDKKFIAKLYLWVLPDHYQTGNPSQVGDRREIGFAQGEHQIQNKFRIIVSKADHPQWASQAYTIWQFIMRFLHHIHAMNKTLHYTCSCEYCVQDGLWNIAINPKLMIHDRIIDHSIYHVEVMHRSCGQNQ